MMLFFRMLLTVLRSRRRSRIDALDASVMSLQVMPNDLDINGHMNNGRYLTIMDLGRSDLLTRFGLLGIVFRKKWRPLVGSAMIRFFRSLQPFQRYTLTSRVVAWDEKWFFMEQKFEAGGQLIAVAFVKGLLRAPDGNVSPERVMQAIGSTAVSPAMPESIRLWQEAEMAAYPRIAKADERRTQR